MAFLSLYCVLIRIVTHDASAYWRKSGQTSRALEHGATAEEIFETCSVAISMGGTLAWSNALVVADYLREKEIIK
ncbi:MAG TPA: hypothetical protein ENN35_06115 [Deltaproteobacteria bacterium]|nr:hypothetical protein [Deltaproteobacteria bacterium]